MGREDLLPAVNAMGGGPNPGHAKRGRAPIVSFIIAGICCLTMGGLLFVPNPGELLPFEHWTADWTRILLGDRISGQYRDLVVPLWVTLRPMRLSIRYRAMCWLK